MKKIIALFLLTIMTASLLVGCADTGDQSGKGNNPQANVGNSNEENKGPDNNKENSNGSVNTNDGNNNNQTNKDPEPTYTIGTAIGNQMRGVDIAKIIGGETVNVTDYRGKIVIFNCWATWCYPCTSELPHFEEFAENYKDDVVIIAAHTAYKNENAYSYVSTNYPNSSIIFAYDTPYDAAYTAAGGNGYVPYTVILDRNGVIVYSDSGPLSYEQLKSFWEQYK